MNATTAASATAPTHTDAGRAADALVAQGAERVLMFGSVARGSQCEHSDIDLVAVLPDLDYRSRRAAHERLRAAADAACGGQVDVIVTDRAEWRIQTECVSGSFANAIADDLVVLADCTPPPKQPPAGSPPEASTPHTQKPSPKTPATCEKSPPTTTSPPETPTPTSRAPGAADVGLAEPRAMV